MNHYQEELHALIQHGSEFIAYFELAENKMQGWQQKIEQQAHQLHLQQQQLEKTLIQINTHHEYCNEQMIHKLNQYDPQQFQLLAHEHCQHIEKTTTEANKYLLKKMQIRFNIFAIISTLLTAFIVVLYLNSELPWEMHHQAKNERQAGKLLLQAWPQLSQKEKNRILGYVNH